METFLSRKEFDTFNRAIKIFGFRNQEDVAIEEMSELTKAIIKNRRYNTDETKANILEEMADVLIMLYQLMNVYGVPSQVFKAKVDRLKKRLDEEEEIMEGLKKLVDDVYSKIPQQGSMPITKNCKNLEESFGEICVKCNACGRFKKEEEKVHPTTNFDLMKNMNPEELAEFLVESHFSSSCTELFLPDVLIKEIRQEELKAVKDFLGKVVEPDE